MNRGVANLRPTRNETPLAATAPAPRKMRSKALSALIACVSATTGDDDMLRSETPRPCALGWRKRVASFALSVLFGSSLYAQVVTDKMVASINGRELITYSDLVWQLALQPNTPIEGLRPEALQSALQLVIDQRLIAQEAERLPTISPSDEEINNAVAELIKRFPSEAEFRRRLELVGLTADRLRQIMRQRLEIEKYLDFRFRSFTVVTPEEVASYYRDVYVPRFRRLRPGLVVPTLEEVRNEIERDLMEDKVAAQMNEFLDQARARADVVILVPEFDREAVGKAVNAAEQEARPANPSSAVNRSR